MVTTTHSGFQVDMSIDDGKGPEWISHFFDRFLAEAIDGHGLSFGGSPDGGFVMAVDGTTTEGHRQAVHEWLIANDAQNIQVGALVDAND